MIVPPLLKNVDVISVFYFPSFSSHLLFSQSLLLIDDLNTWFTIFCLPPVPELFLVIFNILVWSIHNHTYQLFDVYNSRNLLFSDLIKWLYSGPHYYWLYHLQNLTCTHFKQSGLHFLSFQLAFSPTMIFLILSEDFQPNLLLSITFFVLSLPSWPCSDSLVHDYKHHLSQSQLSCPSVTSLVRSNLD